ncbi:MarR family transcriptional regulator [Actinomyces denticolens]|nr:MarR family transcriptional regulator [Actinomyces denticolens]
MSDSRPTDLPDPANVVLKGVREGPAPDDGARVLVDRLWPRGVSKERAALDEWAKDAAPSTGLRRAFHSGACPGRSSWRPTGPS